MKTKKYSLLLFMCLAACSNMNTRFSCNATAGDSCLGIAEVDAMTEKTNQVLKSNEPKGNVVRIWFGPWHDSNGVHHGAHTVEHPLTKTPEVLSQ